MMLWIKQHTVQFGSLHIHHMGHSQTCPVRDYDGAELNTYSHDKIPEVNIQHSKVMPLTEALKIQSFKYHYLETESSCFMVMWNAFQKSICSISSV